MTDEWFANHQKKCTEANFAIKNPWTDKMCYKTGLCETYICSTITEILRISAELDVTVKLNNPNPVYHTLIEMISSLLKSKNKAKVDKTPEEYLSEFQKLVDYIDKHKPLKQRTFERWPYKMGDVDIRALDTIEECLTFLFTFFIPKEKIS